MVKAKDDKGKKPMAMEIIPEEETGKEEEFSFPILHREEEFSFPVFHQEEEFSFPIANSEVKPPLWRGSKKLAAGIAERGRRMRAEDATAQLLFYTNEAFSPSRSASHRLQMLEWAFTATGVLKTTVRSGEEEDAPPPPPLRCAIRSEPAPEFFVCPVAKKIMDEPVVIASGKVRGSPLD